MLHNSILTIALAIAQVITLIDVVPALQVERPKTREVRCARRVGKDGFALGVTGRVI